MSKNLINRIVTEFKNLSEVEGIALAGSQAFESYDNLSDIDINIYIGKEIPLSVRRQIAEKFEPVVMEIGHTFSPEDEWELKDADIDIAYIDIKWIKEYLENLVIKCNADVGYSTYFWHNVVDSEILYDRNGAMKSLKETYDVDYPDKLRQNIIDKNYPLLRKNISSYYKQIVKAMERDDYVSVNHRVAAFLASYFDIIFAVNKVKHTGKKRLLRIVEEHCKVYPDNMTASINSLIESNPRFNILHNINRIIDNLDEFMDEQEQ